MSNDDIYDWVPKVPMVLGAIFLCVLFLPILVAAGLAYTIGGERWAVRVLVFFAALIVMGTAVALLADPAALFLCSPSIRVCQP